MACSLACGPGDVAVGADRLGDLRADPHGRVQRPGRVLEHHRHVRAAVPRSWSSDRPISWVPRNRAEPVTTAPGGSSPMTARQLTVLPEPGLAHDGERLPGVDGVGHPVDRAHLAARRGPER